MLTSLENEPSFTALSCNSLSLFLKLVYAKVDF